MKRDMPQGKKTVSDDEIVDVLDELEGGFGSATEVADYFGLSRQWAHSRLSDLVERGEIEKKQPSPQNVIYWSG